MCMLLLRAAAGGRPGSARELCARCPKERGVIFRVVDEIVEQHSGLCLFDRDRRLVNGCKILPASRSPASLSWWPR
eukprot:5904280-Prymnesium_polylepis.1